MMLIFPELESSLNIAFHNPSRKGRNRFPKAQDVTSPPVEKILWDQISLEGKLKKHVQEVASIYITKVPRLMAKLDEAEEKKSAKWKSLQSGVMKSYNTNNWSECRNRMVAEYLSGRFTTKQARAKNPHAPPKSFGADIPEADGTVENLAAMSGTNSGTLFDDNNIVTEETSTNPFKDNSETTAEDTTTNPFDAGSKPDSSTNPFEDNSKTSTEDTNTNPFDEVSEPDRNTNPFDKKYIDTNNHA